MSTSVTRVAAVLLGIVGCQAVYGQPFHVACNPSTPIAYTGDTVDLYAWTTAAAKDVTFTWAKPTSGHLQASGSSARWDLAQTAPGAYAVDVQAVRAQQGQAQCRIVVMVEPAKERGLLEGRAFLLSSRSETAGYGLYTYVLFGSRPATPDHTIRYKRILEALVRVDDLIALQRYGNAPATLNVVYLPVTEPMPDKLRSNRTQSGYTAIADWALSKYDYERASTLLRRLDDKIDRHGVFLVSDLAPLSSQTAGTQQVFFKTLTTVPPEYAWAYINNFLNRTTQRRSWTAATLQDMALDARAITNGLAVAYDGMSGKVENLLGWSSKR